MPVDLEQPVRALLVERLAWLSLLPAILGAGAGVVVYRIRRDRRLDLFPTWRAVACVAASVVCGGIAAIALVPAAAYPSDGERHLEIAILPDVLGPASPAWDLIASQYLINVLLFVPLGLVVAAASASARRPAITAIGLCAAVSVTLELTQFWLANGRVSSINDVIANTVGGAAGYCVFRFCIRVFGRQRGWAARTYLPVPGKRYPEGIWSRVRRHAGPGRHDTAMPSAEWDMGWGTGAAGAALPRNPLPSGPPASGGKKPEPSDN